MTVREGIVIKNDGYKIRFYFLLLSDIINETLQNRRYGASVKFILLYPDRQ
jgi:hypothetical protein